MKLKKIIAGHLLVLIMVFPPVVFAEDFTFNIEVEISNLHSDVNQMRILCEVEGITLKDPFATINVPAEGGAINTTVQVKFNATDEMPSLSPEAMPMQKGYNCKLQVSKAGEDFQEFLPSNSSQCNSANDWRCARTGSPFTGNLSEVFDVYKE